jgi:tRNA-dihydrouridine synthase
VDREFSRGLGEKQLSFLPKLSISAGSMMSNDPLTAISKPIGLAPMEGVTDFPTRLWYRFVGGAQFMYTPFLRVTDTFPRQIPDDFFPEAQSSSQLLGTPVHIQLMGPDENHIIRAGEIFLRSAPDHCFVDLNCGCPSPTVTGRGSGSSLLQTVALFSTFVTSVAVALGPKKLSVKMRLGFHNDELFEDLIQSIRGLSLHHLTIHARTRDQRYTGQSNWSKVILAAATLPFPVYLSGDVKSHEMAQNLLEAQTHLAGLLIGRGALRHPWVFYQDAEPLSLLAPLEVYLLCHHLQLDGRLVPWYRLHEDALGRQVPVGFKEHGWEQLRMDLSRFASPDKRCSESHGIAINPKAFARLKMLWSYVRTSLPDPFMAPDLLRSKNFHEFSTIFKQKFGEREKYALSYQSHHDWLFCGEGRNKVGC